jgi:RHS repeat-associated protein
VVLKRQTNTSNTSPADTYYAYDNKDRLVRVIPPGASTSNTDLVFAYQYDARDRMTRKKVPDMGSISMRYNLRDQLVFVQDSMQAGLIRCLGTKYDVYGRPIESGFVAGFPTDPEAAFSFFESLTQTHYDGFDGSTTLNLTTNPQYRGKVRRSRTKILGTSDWLSSTFDYDTHGRTTAVNTNNHLNPTVLTAEQISMSYDWADNVVYENRNHNPGAAGATGSFSVQNTITFDHAGRRTNFITTIGGVGAHIAEYNYNHRDELIEKNLHSNQVASVWGWLQSVDYSYNAQGWLTGINTYANSATVGVPALCSPSMPNPATPIRTVYNETSDAFYMDIRYDQTFGGVAGSIQKSGNIAQLAYRVRGRETHIYSYAYDYLNRLTSATFNEYSDAGSITNSNKYNESLTYDLRGNIQTLQRTGYYQNGSTCTYGQIDNLSYTYTTNTNRVHRIQDAVTTTGATARGFNPNGQGATNDAMTYDRNGNLNKNNYKNVSAITYNHLNLPTLITFNTGNSIEFLYDAVGTKLRKTVKVGATVQYVQDYLSGGIEYRQNGTGVKRVESVFHVEGRYYNTNVDASNTLAWRREYNIKDHLGNTRVVISDRNANGVLDITSTASTSDVLQENHYYAFGLGFEGPWVQNDAASRDNKYQYNGKELNDDFGLNWSDYGARWYDAAIGRWGGVDLLSSKFSSWSPYNYVLCNPMQNTDPDGKDVIVNRDGNHISISYRGALIDESGQLTKKAVRQIRREITSNLKKIFTGAGDGITFGIDVQLRQVSSSSKLKENENSVTLVNSKDKRLPEGFSGYAPNGFDALVNVEGKNISGIAKTATHEIGHNFGLPHNVHDFTSKGFEKLPFGESMEVFKYLEANIIQQGHPAAGNLMLPGNQETAAGMNITPSQILHIYQDSDSGKLNSRNISGSSDKWGTYSSDRPVVNAYGKVIKE